MGLGERHLGQLTEEKRMNTKKKIVVGGLSVLAGLCFFGSAITFNGASAETSPLTMEGASIKIQTEEVNGTMVSAIRFVSRIEKNEYSQLVDTHGELTVTTRVVPTYILGNAALTSTTVLSDRSKGDIVNLNMTGKQFTVKENDVEYYEFRAYVEDIPEWGYYEDIVSMSYITNSEGELVCETAAIERSIDTVAEKPILDLSATQDEEKYKYATAIDGMYSRYDTETRACIVGYTKSPLIGMLESNRAQTIEAGATVTLNTENLKLLVEDNEGASNLTYAYRVTYNGEQAVTLSNNTFTAAEDGYYTVVVTATDSDENAAWAELTLVVEGTYAYTFEGITEMENGWGALNAASLSLYKAENGNQSWMFTTVADKNTLDIPALNYDKDSIQAGDPVRVSMWVKMVANPATNANGVALNVIKVGADSNSGTVLEESKTISSADGIYKLTYTTPLFYDEETEVCRLKGMQIGAAYTGVGRTFTFYIDNIVISEMEIAQMSVASREVTVQPSTAFTLSAENLGLTVDSRATLSYAVTYNDSQAVTLTNDGFTTAANGYYAVIVTATYPDATTESTYLLLIVDGTYVYGFDTISALTGTWVPSGAKSGTNQLVEDANGDKSWQFVANQMGVTLNIPVLNYDSANIAVGETIKVSFTVKLTTDPEFGGANNDVRLDNLEVKNMNTNYVSSVKCEKISNGLYRVTVEAKLYTDTGTGNNRVQQFQLYGGYWNADRTFTYNVDNIVVSKL